MVERLTSLPLGNGATRGDHPVRLDKGPRCTAHERCWTLSMPEAICPFSSFKRARRVSFGRLRDERDLEQHRVSSEQVMKRDEGSAGAGCAVARESFERNRPREPSGL